MKDYNNFNSFLNSNQIHFDLILIASTGLNYLSLLSDDKTLSSISSALDFTVKHLFEQYNKIKSSQSKNNSDILDFLDSTQIYLEILATCYSALNYYHNLSGDSQVRSIAVTINSAIEELMKAYDNFSLAKSQLPEGGSNHE